MHQTRRSIKRLRVLVACAVFPSERGMLPYTIGISINLKSICSDGDAVFNAPVFYPCVSVCC